jgi:hypothetical protein
MLSITRQFGSAARAGWRECTEGGYQESLFVRVVMRAIFMLNIPTLFLLSGPRGTRAGPGRKRIPFGPPHSALFVTYSDKNKRSIIPAAF